jgi:hypothetical protein
VVASVNALLLVQMFHFIVGYVILKYLFLKPGLAVATACDEIDQGLRRDLALMQEEVRRQEGIANDQWERHCRVLCSRMPVGTQPKYLGVARIFPSVEPLPPAEEKRLAEGVTQAIISCITRGS